MGAGWTAWVVAVGCGWSEGGDEPVPLPVAVPAVRTAVAERDFVAELRAARHAEVRARIDGLLAVSVDEGQRVRAGDVLFSVQANALEQELQVALAAVVGAQAGLDAARLERDQTRVLVDRAVVSPAELAVAEARVRASSAEVQEARAAAELARVRRDASVVTAPFDGVVNRIPTKGGSAVEAGTLLTTVSDASEVFAWFHLSEREALTWTTRAEEGPPREVALVLADGTRYPHPGVVDAMAGEIDPDTGTLGMRARFPNPDGWLRHGATGAVRVRDELPGALLVPQQATLDVQGNYFVYVVDGQDVPRLRKIVPRLRLGEDFVLESGLSPTDRFLLEGLHSVREGEPITTRDAAVGS